MIEQAKIKNSLLESASEAFETTVMLPIEEAAAPENELDASQLFVGSITFTGRLQGAVNIHCHQDVGVKIAKSMLMAEEDETLDDSEVVDAIGEVVNLVIGGMKSRIQDTVGDLDISIPTVLKGKNIKTVGRATKEFVEVFAKTDGGELKISAIYSEPA
jgi:chemotaxis protein CheX